MSQSKWGRTLILAAVVFVLAPAVFYYEWTYKGKKEEREEQAKKLFDVKERPVASIRVVEGTRKFLFKCLDLDQKLCKSGDNSRWEIAEPVRARGDDSNLNGLLSTLSNLLPTETIDLKSDTAEKRAALLREYHLDGDTRSQGGSRRVEVTYSDGKTRTIYLGEQHPVGDTYFGGIAEAGTFQEQKIYLVPQSFKMTFDRDLTFWRDKKLLTLASHQIHGFSLDSKKLSASAERKDGQWVLKMPNGDEVPGDVENIDNLLTGATYLAAKAFVTEDKSDKKAKKTLAATRKYLSLTLRPEKAAPADPKAKPAEEPAPVVLTVYEKKDGKAPLYATVSSADALFELELTAKDRLDKNLKELRLQKLLTSTERFTAKKIVAGDLTLTQENGKWASAGREIDQDKVQAMLDKLSGNRIQEFLTGAQIPSGEASGMKVGVFKGADDKGEKVKEFVFWKAQAKAAKGAKATEKLYARELTGKRKEAFAIDPSVGDALPWNPKAFEKAPTPSPTPSQAAAKK